MIFIFLIILCTVLYIFIYLYLEVCKYKKIINTLTNYLINDDEFIDSLKNSNKEILINNIKLNIKNLRSCDRKIINKKINNPDCEKRKKFINKIIGKIDYESSRFDK